jgi:hypothetical protein
MLSTTTAQCRLVTNHSVVSFVAGRLPRTQCRTCGSEHKYRHAKGGRKKSSSKADLFAEVLSKIDS